MSSQPPQPQVQDDDDTCAGAKWDHIGPGVGGMVAGWSASKLRGHATVVIIISDI